MWKSRGWAKSHQLFSAISDQSVFTVVFYATRHPLDERYWLARSWQKMIWLDGVAGGVIMEPGGQTLTQVTQTFIWLIFHILHATDIPVFLPFYQQLVHNKWQLREMWMNTGFYPHDAMLARALLAVTVTSRHCPYIPLIIWTVLNDF